MDALTGPTGRAGDLAAAKLRRVAAESGVGPDDPLRPLIDALADAVATLLDAVATLSGAVQKIEAAAERAGGALTEYPIVVLRRKRRTFADAGGACRAVIGCILAGGAGELRSGASGLTAGAQAVFPAVL